MRSIYKRLFSNFYSVHKVKCELSSCHDYCLNDYRLSVSYGQSVYHAWWRSWLNLISDSS